MSNINTEMAEFADSLWKNYIQPKMNDSLSSMVTYYRAKVIAKNNDGTIKVQRPYDIAVNVKLENPMADYEIGSTVLVLKYGLGNNKANHIVVAYGDGTKPQTAVGGDDHYVVGERLVISKSEQ